MVPFSRWLLHILCGLRHIVILYRSPVRSSLPLSVPPSDPFFFCFGTSTHTLRRLHTPTMRRSLVKRDHVSMSVDKRWDAVQGAYQGRSKERLEPPSGRARVHMRRPYCRMCMGPVQNVYAAQEHSATYRHVSSRGQGDVLAVRLGSEQVGCEQKTSTGVSGYQDASGGRGKRGRGWAAVILAALVRSCRAVYLDAQRFGDSLFFL